MHSFERRYWGVTTTQTLSHEETKQWRDKLCKVPSMVYVRYKRELPVQCAAGFVARKTQKLSSVRGTLDEIHLCSMGLIF
jgi:hypothetical protein